jgi:citrate synthase
MSNPAGTAKGLEDDRGATRLSDVRGDIGQLIYCGYDINEWLATFSYEERRSSPSSHNHLPNRKELTDYRATLTRNSANCRRASWIFSAKMPKDTPPMHAIRTGCICLVALIRRAMTIRITPQRRKALRLIAQIPVVTAYFHRCVKANNRSIRCHPG